MALPIKQPITPTGHSQESVDAWMVNATALINDMKAKLNAAQQDLVAIRGNYNSQHASLQVTLLTATFTIPALTASTVTISDLSMSA